MKLIRLSLSRVAGYITNHRLTFTLFLLGITLSSLVFIYFYGNALKTQIAEAENDANYRVFEVFFEENIPLSEDALSLLDSYGIIEVSTRCPATLPEELAKRTPSPTQLTVTAARYNQELLGYPLFTADQLTQFGVLIDKMYGSQLEEILINDTLLPVLGTVNNGSGVIFASMETYLAAFGQTSHLSYQLAEIPTAEEIAEISQRLMEAFPENAGMIVPDFFIQSDQQQSFSELLSAALLYIVSILCFLFLFKYLLDQNRMENIICQMTGASRKQVFGMILLEVAELAGGACLIAILIHSSFYNVFFGKLNTTEVWITYSLGDYLIILVTTVILSLITALPFLIACLQDTPIGLKAKYDT